MGSGADNTYLGFRNRLLAMGSLVLVLASAVIVRAFWVQVAGDPRLDQLAQRQFRAKVLIRPRRGLIVDRTSQPLAVNLEAKSLAADPTKVSRPQATAGALARALGLRADQVRKRLESDRSFVWIKRHLSDTDFSRLKMQGILGRDGGLREGFWLVEEAKRVYPNGAVAAQLLGGVNVDLEGIEGLELWQEDRLRGEVVSVNAYKDALGRPTFIDAEAARHVRDGADVKVTLDGALQFGVERRLKDWVSRTQSEAGSAIVMDAGTGEILALANVPDFDANAKGARAAQRRRNRALTDAYEPGSTVKPFLMAAALLSGFRPHDELWGGKGKFTVQGRTISEAEETEQFEWITLEDMVRRSSNVVAAKLALKLGAKSYVGVLRKMGFGSRSGLGFPGEIPGRIPDDQGMQPLTLANLGFGQGFVATRLQVLRAFGALANGGYLVTPKLVMGDGASAQTDRVRVLPDNVVKAVTRAMVRATEQGGTGERARVEGFQIAGKTGTAQTVDPATRSYSRSRYISSFVGFAVGAGTPVVVFVSLDHPKGHYYAADTAAPLFAEVFEETALRMHLRGPETINERLARVPVKPEPLHSTQAAAVTPSPAVQAALKAMEGDPLVAQEENATAPDAGPVDRTMPSLQGLSAREVVRKLGEAGGDLQVEIRGFGMVRHQTPGVGSPLRKGARVSVLLGEDRR